ncbi:hypothetical protein QYE76_006134 [Lolium multiflorum]|uniref:Uncharacterized protein n=1 Tax=Lolium multiflorum TaxID=4521 RepID=A0AAD8W2Z8_LOLMU|nr:hypothetical protein QYE76_006134 [Lolium multiflorum]
MSSSSSTFGSNTMQQLLPMVPCPRCGDKIVSQICHRGTRPGVRFYMCAYSVRTAALRQISSSISSFAEVCLAS